MKQRFLTIALLLAGAFAFGSRGAVAGPEEGQDDTRAKIKKQMEKILSLMRESEAALLKATTSASGQPTGVEVPLPDGQQPTKSGQASGAGAAGEEVRKQLEQLILGSQRAGGEIPKALEELVRMIPT